MMIAQGLDWGLIIKLPLSYECYLTYNIAAAAAYLIAPLHAAFMFHTSHDEEGFLSHSSIIPCMTISSWIMSLLCAIVLGESTIDLI
jgi:hypothetical protein